MAKRRRWDRLGRVVGDALEAVGSPRMPAPDKVAIRLINIDENTV